MDIVSDTNPEANGTVSELPVNLFEKVEAAATTRDEGKVANRKAHKAAREKLDEIDVEVAAEIDQAQARRSAAYTTRRVLDRLYRANNERLDREYRVAVFGDEVDNVSSYDI